MPTKENENVVFIGKKGTMDYVFAVTTQSNMYNEIILKARGNAINKAVDVSQISINRHLKGWKIADTIQGTEERPYRPPEGIEDPHPDKTTQRVSNIEIILKKE